MAWLKAWKLRRRARLYKRGYIWAHDSLLNERETPLSLEGYISSTAKGPFDCGVRDAMNYLVRVGVVLDDRPY